MAFDGIVTRAVIHELNNVLIGAKVNKVLEPTKNEIILETYNNGEKYNLEISINPETCRIGLTSYLKQNPKNAYNFCMLLRKYLIGTKIVSIDNFDLERTVEIKFEGYNELNDLVKRKLYVEIMSRQSNIILTNEKEIIIDSLRHVESETRTILPANPFTYTAIHKVSFMDLENFDEFYELFSESIEAKITEKLSETFIGFTKIFVRNVITTLNIKDEKFTIDELEKLYDYLKEIIESLETNNVSCIKLGRDFTISLKQKESNLEINNFIDDYYYEKETSKLFDMAKNNLLRIVSGSLKKTYKKLENINQKLKECEHMDLYKMYGELLTANLYRINSNYNLSEVEVLNYYTNENIKIPLDNKITVSKNVEKFFKKYNKLKNTLLIVSDQKEECIKEMDYIESIVYSIENAKDVKDLNQIFEEVSENLVIKKEKNIKQLPKKSTDEKNIPEPILYNGYKIYVGKNNIQNNNLTLKYARANDYWFHTQKIHGSHVILRNDNNEDDIPDDVLYYCANLAVQNSKGKDSKNVSVDYCKIKFVKRAPSGKPGMVNYTNFSTIIVKN